MGWEAVRHHVPVQRREVGGDAKATLGLPHRHHVMDPLGSVDWFPYPSGIHVLDLVCGLLAPRERDGSQLLCYGPRVRLCDYDVLIVWIRAHLWIMELWKLLQNRLVDGAHLLSRAVDL